MSHELLNRALSALALNCTLKATSADEPSSTDKLLNDMLAAMEPYGVQCEVVRVADHDIKPGVRSDEGPGDEWPDLRKRILAADIFILGMPIWLGQPSSIAKRVLERLDAFLDETDDAKRMPAAGKVAVVAVVGNEDGAHHCHAASFQALNDVGFTTGQWWGLLGRRGHEVGELRRAEKVPKEVNATLEMLASNTTHLARILKAATYPGLPS